MQIWKSVKKFVFTYDKDFTSITFRSWDIRSFDKQNLFIQTYRNQKEVSKTADVLRKNMSCKGKWFYGAGMQNFQAIALK